MKNLLLTLVLVAGCATSSHNTPDSQSDVQVITDLSGQILTLWLQFDKDKEICAEGTFKSYVKFGDDETCEARFEKHADNRHYAVVDCNDGDMHITGNWEKMQDDDGNIIWAVFGDYSSLKPALFGDGAVECFDQGVLMIIGSPLVLRGWNWPHLNSVFDEDTADVKRPQ